MENPDWILTSFSGCVVVTNIHLHIPSFCHLFINSRYLHNVLQCIIQHKTTRGPKNVLTRLLNHMASTSTNTSCIYHHLHHIKGSYLISNILQSKILVLNILYFSRTINSSKKVRPRWPCYYDIDEQMLTNVGLPNHNDGATTPQPCLPYHLHNQTKFGSIASPRYLHVAYDLLEQYMKDLSCMLFWMLLWKGGRAIWKGNPCSKNSWPIASSTSSFPCTFTISKIVRLFLASNDDMVKNWPSSLAPWELLCAAQTELLLSKVGWPNTLSLASWTRQFVYVISIQFIPSQTLTPDCGVSMRCDSILV